MSRRWAGWLAATAAVFGVAWAVLTALDTAPRPLRLLLLVALAMGVLMLVHLASRSEQAVWTVHSTQPGLAPGQDARLDMYTRTIAGHLDARHPDSGLRDRLATLADTRLRQRHGVDLHGPEVGRLLGDDVVAVLLGPAHRLSRGEIETCVRRIEGL